MRIQFRSLAAALLLATIAGPATASDGVLEINQTCAVQTGCFSGDTAGFPVTIDGTAGSSYRLTSNLILPNENTDGIRLAANDISIDLAGFEIRGPVVCSGTPLACTPSSGTGSGVERSVSSLSGSGHSVRNGSIRGMGAYGVLLGAQAEVTELRVRSNRLDGIQTSFASIVSRSTAHQNGGIGISVSSGSIVSRSSAYLNGSYGILASRGCTVSESSAFQNAADGIIATSGSTVSGSSAHDNGTHGIRIYASDGGGALVHGNSVSSNDGFGLNLHPQAGYRENVISNQVAGTVTGGVDLGNNACNGSTTCP